MNLKQLNTYFNKLNFISLLIPIYIFALVGSILVVEIIIILIILSYLFYCSKVKIIKDFNTIFFWYFIFFYIYINLVSVIFSENIFLSLKNTLFYLRHAIFILGIIWILNMEKNYLNIIKKIIFFIILILTIDGYCELIFGQNLFGYKNQLRPDRLSGLFFDELILGSFLSKMLPILIGLNALKPKNGVEKLIFWSTITLVYFLIFFTGERAAFFSINLFFILYFMIVFNSKKNIKIFILILFTLFLFSTSNNMIKDRYITTFENELTAIDTRTGKRMILPYYYGHYYISLQIFKSSPIFGLGPKSFRLECNKPKFQNNELNLKPWGLGCSTHPHNYYLQLLSETGLIGFLFIILIFIRVILNYYKILYQKLRFNQYNNIKTIFVCNMITALWPLRPSGNFFNNWISTILSFSFALYINFADSSLLKKWKSTK